MAKIYACLLGEWIDITETETLITTSPELPPLKFKEWLDTKSPIRADGLNEEDLKEFKEKILQRPLIEISFHLHIIAIPNSFNKF